MRTYIIRRLLLIIPTLFILTILVFLSVRFLPGDIIDLIATGVAFQGGEIDREAMEHILGLDVPVHVQYGRWLGVLPTPDWATGEYHFKGLLQGTLGTSLFASYMPIEESILDRLPVTIELGVMSHHHRASDSAASRHLLGDSSGYSRRLRGALHRHHRPGNA